MLRKFIFCLSVGRGADIEETITLEIDESLSIEEQEAKISNEYYEWISEKNKGGLG